MTPRMPDPTDFVRGDPEAKYKSIAADVGRNADPKRRDIIPCFMSTDSVDADNEILLPDGCDLSRYTKNPVVQLCHANGQPGCYYPLPVGKSEWTQKRPHGVEAGVRFTDKTVMGREVKALFDDDMLRSFSVGFSPVEASWLTYDEAQTRADWKAAYDRTKGRVMVHRKWLLLELSVAPIPSNADALVITYKSKGIAVPAWLSLPSPIEAPAMPETATQATAEGGTISRTKNTSRFDLGRKAVGADDTADGIAATDVTPADARVMVALWVPPETASAIAVPGGEAPEDLHLTLCYLGRAIEIGTNAIDRLKQMCRDVAASTPPLLGKIGGVGRFSASDTSDGKDVIYASADLPELAACRERLANILQYSGIAYSKAHGFTPHITLAYVDPDAESPVSRIDPTPVAFTHLCLSIEGKGEMFPFNTLGGYGYDGPYAYRSVTEGGVTVKTIASTTKCYMGKGLSLGDHVRHIPSGSCGVVKSLHSSGTHPFDSTGEQEGEVEAGEETPVALVAHHKKGCKESGATHALYAHDLAVIPKDMEDGDGEETESVKGKALSEGSGTAGGYTVKDDEDDDTETASLSPDAESEEAAEDMDEDGETAEGGGFQAGHHVRIRVPNGYKGVGIVKGIYRKGHVPNVAENLRGTPEEPAARVEAHKAIGDGHVATGDHVGVLCKHLTHLPEEMKAPTKAKAAPRPSAKAAPSPVLEDLGALPPLVALSDEEVQRQYLDGIKQIPAIVNQAVERALGCV